MVVPADTPVTVPVPETVAVAGIPLPQIPPVVPSVNVVEDKAQTWVAPEIADGTAFTVTTADTLQPLPSE